MRFFLPELYAALQTEDPAAETRWEEAGRRYLEHLNSVRPHLPPGAAEFSNWNPHDGFVRRATGTDPLVIDLDLSMGLDWNHLGYHRVAFVGCTRITAIENLVNHWIIDTEFDLSPHKSVCLRFLCDKGETEIVCQDISATTIPYGKKLLPDGTLSDDANEQDILRRISELKTAGMQPREIIKALNESRRLNRYGNAWKIKDLKIAIAPREVGPRQQMPRRAPPPTTQ